MLENFEVDTNIVKLRTDRFSSMKIIWDEEKYAPPSVKAGALVSLGSCCGIAVNDAEDGDELVVIYRADKIMLPCKGDIEVGTVLGAEYSAGKWIMTENGTEGDVGTIYTAISLEEIDTGGDVKWVLCDLLGSPVIIADEGAVT
ncbi:MAG TPA: DUF2190 family protein [Ruminococcus sp.]|nr:DUF2190 family protein [Ruminococcus sp.]